MPQSFPSHVLVPRLDAEYADLGLGPFPFQVCGKSESPEGVVYLQVFTGAGYLWLAPADYQAFPKCYVCGEFQPDHSTTGLHQFWAEADAAAEFAALPSGPEPSPSASESHDPADWNLA